MQEPEYPGVAGQMMPDLGLARYGVESEPTADVYQTESSAAPQQAMLPLEESNLDERSRTLQNNSNSATLTSELRRVWRWSPRAYPNAQASTHGCLSSASADIL